MSPLQPRVPIILATRLDSDILSRVAGLPMQPDSLALPAKNCASRKRLSTAIILEILWDSAFKSLYRAFALMVFGSIALGIAGSIWQEMAPSKGPGINVSLGEWGNLSAPFKGHSFAILWTCSFAVVSVFHLARFLPDPRHRHFVKRLRRIERKFSENWFQLIVSNAIVAMVSAFIITLVSQFTWTALFWNELIKPVIAWIFQAVSALIGLRSTGVVQDWMNWYGENTLKFTFWTIYLGSIADDLGLPNVKTLGRRLWHRFVSPNPTPAAPQRFD
jgi:hypothetical protein